MHMYLVYLLNFESQEFSHDVHFSFEEKENRFFFFYCAFVAYCSSRPGSQAQVQGNYPKTVKI